MLPWRAFFLTVLGVGFVAVYLPAQVTGAAPWLRPRPGVVGWLAAWVVASGLALIARSVALFVRWGRGTPAPWAPPERLVVQGPYRYVRNPMYIGVLLLLAGQSVVAPSAALLSYIATAAVTAHLVVVFVEEPGLARRFGRVYDRYRDAVPRWMPRPPARDDA